MHKIEKENNKDVRNHFYLLLGTFSVAQFNSYYFNKTLMPLGPQINLFR